MSNQVSNKDQNYETYLHRLSNYSTCIRPILKATFERYDNAYDVNQTIDLERYCVYERREVEKYRQLLKSDLTN